MRKDTHQDCVRGANTPAFVTSLTFVPRLFSDHHKYKWSSTLGLMEGLYGSVQLCCLSSPQCHFVFTAGPPHGRVLRAASQGTAGDERVSGMIGAVPRGSDGGGVGEGRHYHNWTSVSK